MTPLALSLVLSSAFLHAAWNLLAKRVSRGAPFVWLFALASIVMLAPPAIWQLARDRPRLGVAELAVIGASAAVHLGYMIALQRGYRAGDLSLVYPLARGTGPALAVIGAVLILGERPTPLALSGVGLVVLGAFLLAGGDRLFRSGRREAAAYGLLTGTFIAGYTLIDAHGVSELAIPPLVLLWGGEVLRTAMLTPLVLRRLPEVRALWRDRRREVLAIAVLSPAAYLLILFAFRMAPVSYVAPLREISILFGAILGASLLREEEAARRLLAAALMVVGVAALYLG